VTLLTKVALLLVYFRNGHINYNHESLPVCFSSLDLIIIIVMIIIVIRRQITKSTLHPDNTPKNVGRLWHFGLRNGKQSNKSEYNESTYRRKIAESHQLCTFVWKICYFYARFGYSHSLSSQCSTTHCVHIHTLIMLPRSTVKVHHGAQQGQTGWVIFSTNLYSNPLCFWWLCVNVFVKHTDLNGRIYIVSSYAWLLNWIKPKQYLFPQEQCS